MSDQDFAATLSELHIEPGDTHSIADCGDGSYLLALMVGSPNFSDAEFILKRAGYKVATAHSWFTRGFHIVPPHVNIEPNTLRAIGFVMQHDNTVASGWKAGGERDD